MKPTKIMRKSGRSIPELTLVIAAATVIILGASNSHALFAQANPNNPAGVAKNIDAGIS